MSGLFLFLEKTLKALFKPKCFEGNVENALILTHPLHTPCTLHNFSKLLFCRTGRTCRTGQTSRTGRTGPTCPTKQPAANHSKYVLPSPIGGVWGRRLAYNKSRLAYNKSRLAMIAKRLLFWAYKKFTDSSINLFVLRLIQLVLQTCRQFVLSMPCEHSYSYQDAQDVRPNLFRCGGICRPFQA